MELHKQFYATLLEIHPKLKEDISRGIGNKKEAKLALRFLGAIAKNVDTLERIKFEFDVDEAVQVEADLLRLKVTIIELTEIISNNSEDQHEITKAYVFLDELFRVKRELMDWSGQHSSSGS